MRRETLGAVLVVGTIRLQLGRRQQRQQLPLVHRVTFGHLELGDLTGKLRADHDVLRRDDASERQRRRRLVGDPIPGATADGRNDQQGE